MKSTAVSAVCAGCPSAAVCREVHAGVFPAGIAWLDVSVSHRVLDDLRH